MTTTQILYTIILAAAFITCSVDNTKEKHDDHSKEVSSKVIYTCAMHPSIMQEAPGRCPICGMDLVQQSDIFHDDILTLNARQLQLANISMQKISTHNEYNTTPIQARLVVDETRTTNISSRVAGRIEKLFIKETGRMITQGEPLYEIYSETLLTLQQEYLVAKEQIVNSENENAVSKSLVQAAEKKLILYGLNKNQINDLAKSKKFTDHVIVMAPVTGLIKSIAINEGQYVLEGYQIYQIDDISTLWVEADVYPNELSSIKRGDKIRMQLMVFENKSIETTVNFVSPEYKSGTQTITIRGTIKNNNMTLKPGMQVLVFTNTTTHEVTTVPKDAVIHDYDKTYVLVDIGANTFKAREIKTNMENSERTEIIEGLTEDDFVVVTGAYLLYSEMVLRKGTGTLGGHNH